MNLKQEISDFVIQGNKTKTIEKVKEACDLGESPNSILELGLLEGMKVVGERFKNDKVFIPEVLASASAMHGALDVLKPFWEGKEAKNNGKVLIGTVFGDVHDIGKNIVAMMLTAARFEVIDLGVNISVEKFVESVKIEKPDVLALSALLTTTMPMFKITIEAVKKAGIEVKTIIGGAQVRAKDVEISGADAHAPNAVVGVDVIGRLVTENTIRGNKNEN